MLIISKDLFLGKPNTSDSYSTILMVNHIFSAVKHVLCLLQQKATYKTKKCKFSYNPTNSQKWLLLKFWGAFPNQYNHVNKPDAPNLSVFSCAHVGPAQPYQQQAVTVLICCFEKQSCFPSSWARARVYMVSADPEQGSALPMTAGIFDNLRDTFQ